MKYFTNCKTIDEAKALHKRLMKKHHPDHGGDSETCKIINNEFDEFLEMAMFASFRMYEKDTGFRSKGNPDKFSNILKKIISWNINIEIIGYWIYAFDAYEYKDKLKSLGFWFSKKHRAWVFSGGPKRKIQTVLTTDDIRVLHGSEQIREKEEILSIGA